jgi:hypothetical protein
MKKKQLLINFFFAIAILFSILFPSFHGYEHLEKQFAQKVCYHKHNSKKAELTHQHKGFDHCLVCEFTFSNYISPRNFSYQLESFHTEIVCFLNAIERVYSFSGSLYAHRGPPIFV